MSGKMRLAVLQLRCHPAFNSGPLAYLEEPFFPASPKESLSHLIGLNIPGFGLQEELKESYVSWHTLRIASLLSHPLLNEDIPTLILFSEGSIPVNSLLTINDFANSSHNVVLAGSHTILDSIGARDIYRTLGKERELGKRPSTRKDVMFIFVGGKIHQNKKNTQSPYDRTEITTLEEKEKIPIRPYPMKVDDEEVKFVPLICADALQSPTIIGDYNVVCIASFEKDPSNFDSYINSYVGNGKIVLYCNDGHFGNSSIRFPVDRRSSNWLFDGPLGGCLPKGDSILIIDVPVRDLATQVGVTNPKAQCEVKLLASVTYDATKSSEHHIVSQEMLDIKNISNNQARCSRLDNLLTNHECTALQNLRLNYLREQAKRGADFDVLWDVYGQDYIISQEDITDIENSFAEKCESRLYRLLIDNDLPPESDNCLKAFLRRCKERITISAAHMPKKSYGRDKLEDIIVDRDNYIKSILSFFDSKREFALAVIGFPQIGKTSIIAAALNRTYFKKVKRIRILKTTSEELILAEISGSSEKKSLADLSLNISNWNTIWFENTENLLISGKWRSAEIESAICAIVSLAYDKQVKIIFESSRALPFEMLNVPIINSIRILGFEKDAVKYGIDIIDNQLRRIQFNPNDVRTDVKSNIVADLGGHPVALLMCANAIYQDGLSEVLRVIKEGSGFYRQLTDRIVNMIDLTEEDIHILKLLSGARIEILRDVIVSCCDFAANNNIASLIQQCLIEAVSPTTIQLSGILRIRYRFLDLSLQVRQNFHRAASAAYQQLAKDYTHRIDYAVEAEYHSLVINEKAGVNSGVKDAAYSASFNYFNENNFEKARSVLLPLLNSNASLDIIRLSSMIEAKLGNFPDALNNAERVLTHNPADNELFSNLGKEALTQSRPEYGERLIAIGRRTGVNRTTVSFYEGRIALRNHDLPHAEECFKTVISSGDNNRRNPWAYFYLGRLYMMRGNIPKAIEILEEGQSYTETFSRSKARILIKAKLGEAYVLDGDFEPAGYILDELMRQNKNDPEVLYSHWLLTVMRDGVEKASEAFEVFRNARPQKKYEKGHYHLYYGLFLRALDRLAEANDHFEQAFSNESSNVYIMLKYAENLYDLACRHSRNMEANLMNDCILKCAKMLRRIYDFDPDNESAQDIEANLYNDFDYQLKDIPAYS